MSVLYYKCALGVFPVIADDTIFTYINSMAASGILVDRWGTVTALGSEFASVIPTGLIFTAYRYNSQDPIDPTIYNIICDLLGCSISIVDITASETIKYPVSDNPDKLITITYDRGPNYLEAGSFTFQGFNYSTVLGTLAKYTSAPIFNGMYLPLLFSNSSMTEFLEMTLSGYTPSTTSKLGYNKVTPDASTNVGLTDYFTGLTPYVQKDPYEPGGTSSTGGGTGDFDGTSDPVDIPPLPTLSAVDTGLITIYAPTKAQVIQLANYLWTDPTFDIANLRKLFANPMDCILGMSIVPVHVPTGSTQTLMVGNIATTVNLTVAASQYVEVDCGSLNVNEYWGAYLDYDPYTKAEIYLPYIGTQPLSVDDIMGKTVHVVYHIDILSGACCAYVKCGSSVLYSFIGQCTSSVPVSGNDWTSVVNGALSIAGQLGGLAAGAANPVSSLASMASTALTQMKPSIEKSGAMAGTGGLMGVQTPYIILTRPRQALPQDQAHFTGYPAFITRPLSTVSGYTEVEEIHMEGIPATAPELRELESLLKGGVLF